MIAKRLWLVLAISVLFIGPVVLASGGRSVGASPRSSTSPLTVTVPGFLGIDLESDIAFNFNNYATPGPPSATCQDNVFPPTPFCTGPTRYDAQVTHTASLPGNAPQTGAVWLAVFCSKSAGTLAITTNAQADFSPAITGLSITDMRYFQATTSGTNPGVGPASATAFQVSPAVDITGEGTLGGAFGWTRVDQGVDLLVPAGFTFPETPSSTATINFAISK